MDIYKKASEILVRQALDRLSRGDPSLMGFLYDHYGYLHSDIQRVVFKALYQRLTDTQDHILADRMRNGGLMDLGADYPLLSREIAVRFRSALNGVATELSNANLTDIYAVSPPAVSMREAIVRLPLSAIIGAKLRARFSPLLRTYRSRVEEWSTVIELWETQIKRVLRGAVKRVRLRNAQQRRRRAPRP